MAAAALGGGLLVHEDGIDFRLLEPRAFAVVAFIAIPALISLGTAWPVERWPDRERMVLGRKVGLAIGLMPTLLFLFAPLVGIALCGVLAVLAQAQPLVEVARSRALPVVVPASMVLVSAVALV